MVTGLFIRLFIRKLNISLVFITKILFSFILILLFLSQSYFAVSKNIRLNPMHYFIMKIPNKQEVQQTAFNNSSYIDFKNFMNLY